MNTTLNIHTRRCPQCGKEFVPTSQWAYRNKTKTWCSWKCLREDEAGIPPHVPEKPKKPAPAANPPAQPLPVEVVAMAKESEPVKAPRKRRTCPRGGKVWTIGKAAYESMHAGKTQKQIAREMGITLSYVNVAVQSYRNTEHLPGISNEERIRRTNKAMAEKKMRNLSGEKTARLAASINRIHALLAEIREEVGVGA